MTHPAPVLMIQDVWSRWTKASRAAADAGTRLAVPRVHRLPILSGEATIRHEVAALEEHGFEARHLVRRMDDPAWAHDRPARPDNLKALRVGEGFAVSLFRPWDSMLTTRWPAWLASPLFEGGLGDAVRIDWNARFRASVSGSNRSYFYEEHTVWVTLQAAPTDASFLALAPSKHIDLRTTIY